MDFDLWLDQRTFADVLVALLGILAAVAYAVLLARAYITARILLALAHECRRRRLYQEELLHTWGFAPRLDHYRRLESDLERRLAREGLRAPSVPA